MDGCHVSSSAAHRDLAAAAANNVVVVVVVVVIVVVVVVVAGTLASKPQAACAPFCLLAGVTPKAAAQLWVSHQRLQK
jgi:hypothetical protein